ncbi:MAG: putative esterase [Planctomycetota bacterium]|nr:putative esterase [Planctomycetota bacterium]
MNGDRRVVPPIEAPCEPGLLTEARFVPQRYEPNYAYPLLVLFHGRGGDEHQMVRSMPSMSWRNYVGLGLRGPETAIRREHHDGYGWGDDFARADRRHGHGRPRSPLTDREIVRRALADEGPLDPVDLVEDGVFAAVRNLRRTLHVHSERIFLVGCGEGAAVAFRLALSYPERFAGVVAINGWLPGEFRALGRLKSCRDLRILVVHGEWNARAPIHLARLQVAMLRAGGLRVAFQTYPCAHRLTSPMLADVDTWLINQCTSEL